MEHRTFSVVEFYYDLEEDMTSSGFRQIENSFRYLDETPAELVGESEDEESGSADAPDVLDPRESP